MPPGIHIGLPQSEAEPSAARMRVHQRPPPPPKPGWETSAQVLKQTGFVKCWLKQSGLMLDVDTANAEVGKWLRDVANQRVHPVTGQAPAVLFERQERVALQPLPGFATSTQPTGLARWAMPGMAASLQHPLSVYQQLLTEVHA